MSPRVGALLGSDLAHRTDPVLEMVRSGNLAVLDGLNVNRHDPEALAGMSHAEQVARGCSGHLAADDDPISGDENFLDLELHIRDRLREASDHLDRCITAPAFAG